jgi:hypothetical protein
VTYAECGVSGLVATHGTVRTVRPAPYIAEWNKTVAASSVRIMDGNDFLISSFLLLNFTYE